MQSAVSRRLWPAQQRPGCCGLLAAGGRRTHQALERSCKGAQRTCGWLGLRGRPPLPWGLSP